jgi:hypothetical protein
MPVQVYQTLQSLFNCALMNGNWQWISSSGMILPHENIRGSCMVVTFLGIVRGSYKCQNPATRPASHLGASTLKTKVAN